MVYYSTFFPILASYIVLLLVFCILRNLNQLFAGAGDAGMIIPLSTHTLHVLGTTGATGQIVALQA